MCLCLSRTAKEVEEASEESIDAGGEVISGLRVLIVPEGPVTGELVLRTAF